VAVLVALVTVTLNLDTSVTFLTPVVLAAARHQRRDPEPFAYLVVAMSNAGSLLLPGSNLTNLIVLSDTRTTGAAFVGRVAAAWGASAMATVVVVAVLFRRRITGTQLGDVPTRGQLRPGPGALAVVAAVLAMLVLSAAAAALVVVAVGLSLAVLHRVTGRGSVAAIAGSLNPALLLGLFAAACGLGTLGRVWHGPGHLLAHQASWPTAGLGAGAAVVVNNLPAASLLSARPVAHPAALLVGLNLGPNLVLWSSLAGVLWFQAARTAGWPPSVRRFSVLGLAMVPVTMAASLGALAVAH
jgi:arsenical pump membrane protein